MSTIKPALFVLAALVLSEPSVLQAQGYAQRSTRRGAIAGAVIGGLIGARNDEALAGAAADTARIQLFRLFDFQPPMVTDD